MLIPVNQNIDDYKDDFYKGLTLRQSVICLATVIVGAAVYLGLTGIFRLSQTAALYMTLPVIFPIAAYGFLKIHGMNIAEYLRKRGRVKERSSFSFIPQMLICEGAEEAGSRAGETYEETSINDLSFGKEGKKVKILYLETEESLREITDRCEEGISDS